MVVKSGRRSNPTDAEGASSAKPPRNRLFQKYVAVFLAVVALAVIPKSMLDLWLSYQTVQSLLTRVQVEQATAAAEKIGQFVADIQSRMSWETRLLPALRSDEEGRLEISRLLREVPAISELAQIDRNGKERFRTSREEMDVVGSLRDYSKEPFFTQATLNGAYYGPVYYVRQSEPYITIAVSDQKRGDGVLVGRINLKFMWDVIKQIKVGQHGDAYVVDEHGRLIAHQDLSLVLRNTNLFQIDYIKEALSRPAGPPLETPSAVVDLNSRKVLTASAAIPALGWVVFAELPIDEAYAPLRTMIIRSGLLLLAGLGLACIAGFFLAYRMVVPIRRLIEGAEKLGRGDLGYRIDIHTGDELQILGDRVNSMASQLQDSYETLEGKVEERTRQLEAANQAKSRFFAAASHDLRQPLHALGLFLAQLKGRVKPEDRTRIVSRMDAAHATMNDLFNALLDVSKLEAGALTPSSSDICIKAILKRIETNFAESARLKGIRFSVVQSTVWVHSDPILLERILSNLVSNAIRYTMQGGVVMGCRSAGKSVRIEVWDTGPGISRQDQQRIFMEFYRLPSEHHAAPGGLGLGLAIVDRMCKLLQHSVTVNSIPGKGSCFAVELPKVAPASPVIQHRAARKFDKLAGRVVAVIDDDPLVLAGMGGLLRSWGCDVVAERTCEAVIDRVDNGAGKVDLIVSDYQLTNGKTGLQAIHRLNSYFGRSIPAFLMSGDTSEEPLKEAFQKGYKLLHKPVEPAILRAALSHALKKAVDERAPENTVIP